MAEGGMEGKRADDSGADAREQAVSLRDPKTAARDCLFENDVGCLPSRRDESDSFQPSGLDEP